MDYLQLIRQRQVISDVGWSLRRTLGISLEDYSGSYLMDTRISSNSFGINFILSKVLYSKIHGGFGSETGMSFNRISYNEDLRIGQSTSQYDDVFKSSNLYFEPLLELSYKIKFIEIGLHVRYHYQFSNESLQNNKKFKLNNSDVISDWRGFRYGLYLSLWCN